MSDAIQHDDHESHEGPIKTPKQLILAVLFSFLVPIFTIVVLIYNVTSSSKEGAGSEGQTEKAIAARLQRVGMVEVKDLSDPSALKSGQDVFTAQCAACHASGAVGAPKLGDTAAWAPRLKNGFEALLAAALKGKGNMPPQGGGDFTDFEIARGVVHMANASGGQLAEPKPPVAGASAPADAAAASAPAAAAAPATAASK